MHQPAQTLYEKMGGEKLLKQLVETFYDIIEDDPDGELIHALHLKGHGMNHTRLAQFEFLSSFFGGPKLYIERNGHSDMRLIHEHVGVGHIEVETWLLCMDKAIDQVGFDSDLKQPMMKIFTRAAEIIRNQD
ncbi:MAG: hemoglobin [Cocleimonas sp.]|jgi:hemoglobin